MNIKINVRFSGTGTPPRNGAEAIRDWMGAGGLPIAGSMFEAVIFDCDGVLVDSEIVHLRVEAEVLAGIGLDYEPVAYRKRFMGMSERAWYAALDEDALARLGRRVEAELRPIFRERYRIEMERMREVPGAGQAVTALGDRPKAVASSSGAAALEIKLRGSALWDHFAPHVYSADHVTHAKPAPDLFLHAAAQIGVAPGRCLVLEDSANGVRAGLAAGMAVWAFTGGGHMDEASGARLMEAGAQRLVRDWDEAARLFAAL